MCIFFLAFLLITHKICEYLNYYHMKWYRNIEQNVKVPLPIAHTPSLHSTSWPQLLAWPELALSLWTFICLYIYVYVFIYNKNKLYHTGIAYKLYYYLISAHELCDDFWFSKLTQIQIVFCRIRKSMCMSYGQSSPAY